MALDVTYLIVGGGGAGGRDAGGGGGGGAVLSGSDALSSASYSIVVGAGGAEGADGGDSSFNSHTANGGGRGGNNSERGQDGGCGGGGSWNFTTAGTGSPGYSGGAGLNLGGDHTAGGGGGGANQAGIAAYWSIGTGAHAGNGGNGIPSAISGSTLYYGGGGGGGTADYDPGEGGAGGEGGGGAGGYGSGAGSPGTAGTTNRGGGGGGSGNNYNDPGAGGSGVVIIRYLTSDVISATGGTKTTDGSYTIHTFTSSGTFAYTKADVPTATTGAATGVSTTSATLNATVNPNSQATTYLFQYGLTAAYGSQTPEASAGSGSAGVAVTYAFSGVLTPGTTYHCRVVATNASGTTYGADVEFTTTGATPAPTVTTSAASSVAATTATLNGTVNPNGVATTYYFEYGLTTAYGSSTTPASAGSGSANVAVTGALTGLTAANTYHFRLVATSAGGTTYGADLSLNTTGSAPTVTTLAATDVTTSTATLNGTVNPNGLSTTVSFQYGKTTGYGTETTGVVIGSGTAFVAATAALTGLDAHDTYHFRVKAVNATGTTYGNDMVLETTAPNPINKVVQWRLHRFDLNPRQEGTA